MQILDNRSLRFVVFFSFLPLVLLVFSVLSFNDNDINFIEMTSSPVIYDVSGDSSYLSDFIKSKGVGSVFNLAQEGDPYAVYARGVLKFGNISSEVSRNLASAIEDVESSWRLGVVDAGYKLFELYFDGVGVDKNYELALYYLKSSAEFGYLKSQRYLGVAYSGLAGHGLVQENAERAKYWFERAATNGDKLSTKNLAILYYDGAADERDKNMSFEIALSVESKPYGDDMVGLDTLAFFYEKGIGTDINVVQAYKYYDLLSPGSAPDKARLEEKMTPEQIREAIRLSRQWQEEHNIFVPSYYGLEYQEDGSFQ
ncbi:tetratricopeptide repeat protein [Halomonas sp.]|uniref:tetratricopeptide repeat protein n=1 Tax=Halomonas sp. TaxID=1486246 RepID=UPI00257B012A|nr:tetratricopeptide repeat protein [Halomonas sp.]MCJ8284120.1 sel1 repeat family protein [Halomonas sp.]NQY69173.1 sel1 repeat family protein [Halomonas sp.]